MKTKIININLWQGGNLMDNILDFFSKEKPDIVTLQEVYNGGNDLPANFQSLSILKKYFSGWHYYFSPAFLEVKKIGKFDSGNCVFSKYPIVSHKTFFYDVPYGERDESDIGAMPFNPRNLQQVTLTVNKKNIDIFNTQGIWGLDGGDNDRRLAMADTIIKNIETKNTIILTGDFNIRPDTETIKKIEKKLINIFKSELKTSFNIKRKSAHKDGYARAVVDMMFVSKDLSPEKHYCPNVDISDHFPLVAIFDI